MVAIGGAAAELCRPEEPKIIVNDPNPSLAGPKSRTAASPQLDAP